MSNAIADYSTAKGYVQSAFLMMVNPHRLQLPDDSTFFLSFHLLTGFAVELYLKAFLQHAGVDRNLLKTREYGHNLQALLDLAEKHKLDPSYPQLLVNILGKQHGNFEFRYVKVDAKYELKSMDMVWVFFNQLDYQVDKAIGASESEGKTPSLDGGWRLPDDCPEWRF